MPQIKVLLIMALAISLCESYTCNSSNCLPPSQCHYNLCFGQELPPQPITCPTVPCPPKQKCFKEICIPKKPCPQFPCQLGETCRNSLCIKDIPCSQCRPPNVCRNNKCIRSRYDACPYKSCGVGKQCKNSICVPCKCWCGRCVNGVCQKCQNGVIPDGQRVRFEKNWVAVKLNK